MAERGSALPSVLLLMVGSLLAIGLAVEVGRWATVTRAVAFAADVGAEAGAAMLDEEAVRAGELALAPTQASDTAITAALEARPAASRRAAADAATVRVCVTVSQTFEPRLLRFAGVGPAEIEATSCAVPGRG